MSYQIKESEIKRSVSLHCPGTVLVFVFMLLFIFPLFPGGSGLMAQDDSGRMEADFLFGKPKKSIGFHIGLFSPEADSGIFSLATDVLTLKKSDFRDWSLGVDFGYNLHERIDLLFSLDHSSSSNNSEFRDYIGEDNLPITQSTRFSQTPLTVGIKYLLIPRGRQISQRSWVPSSIVPHIDAGAGFLWYKFQQSGDFVDFETMDIFPATLKTSGTELTYYLGCGVEFNIFKSAYINLDFRYSWADADMDNDFVGFDPIELSGYRIATGIQWHF